MVDEAAGRVLVRGTARVGFTDDSGTPGEVVAPPRGPWADEDLAEVVGYKEQEWRDEVPRIGRWFDTFGWRLPREMVDELVNLEIALGTRGTTAE